MYDVKLPYSIQQYSLDAITVCIDVQVPGHLQGLLDIRAFLGKGMPLFPPSPFQPELMRLAELGFDYIDVGTNSAWVAAEIPIHKIHSDLLFPIAGEQITLIKNKIDQLSGEKS